jgi:uncharacterized protein DUF4058
MPMHDWMTVEAGIFHDFHTVWIAELRNTLNAGLLPKGYYALAEQHAGPYVSDVLTLHATPAPIEPWPPPPPDTGGVALAEAPPRVQRITTLEPVALTRRRSLAIRHVSGHRLIALIEIVSRANKDRPDSLDEFAAKAAASLERGVHLLVVDLFLPGSHDPHGIHGLIEQRLLELDEPFERSALPSSDVGTLVAYAAGTQVHVYLEYPQVGLALPEMPLFLRSDRYINVPLEATYQAAYDGLPEFWRGVLEGREPLV